ncbi:Ig-like domain-containing protein [Aequorivita marina]|uniref:Ig-like domain-containing protein n=1 Tax=Aequorivita marina TaxID=3073654 RepID=UPI00287505BD|nr:Ig-like domain-containing protein [Aequorivita sp. S2608]MDS1298634.1 Ig-like domain-containing protein [Aequorivita sp. S2608]
MRKILVIVLALATGISCSSDDEVIDNVGGAPNAIDDAVSTEMDFPVVIDVLSNDAAGDNPLDQTSVRIEKEATNGTTSINSDNGEITYLPDAQFSGTDTFRYKVCDTGDPQRCDTATVTVTVTDFGGGGDL